MMLTAAVFVLCIAAYFGLLYRGSSDADSIEVTVDGKTVAEYSLLHDGEYTVPTVGYILSIRNGEARITESDCPDGICRDMHISHSGGQIVCLPAKLRVAPKKRTTDIRVG